MCFITSLSFGDRIFFKLALSVRFAFFKPIGSGVTVLTFTQADLYCTSFIGLPKVIFLGFTATGGFKFRDLLEFRLLSPSRAALSETWEITL